MTQKLPNEYQAMRASRPKLYLRLIFGLIVLFGIVGNIAGHRDTSMMILIITGTLWCCTRIMEEALDAWRALMLPPPDPPGARPSRPSMPNGRHDDDQPPRAPAWA